MRPVVVNGVEHPGRGATSCSGPQPYANLHIRLIVATPGPITAKKMVIRGERVTGDGRGGQCTAPLNVVSLQLGRAHEAVEHHAVARLEQAQSH